MESSTCTNVWVRKLDYVGFPERHYNNMSDQLLQLNWCQTDLLDAPATRIFTNAFRFRQLLQIAPSFIFDVHVP